MGVHSRLVKSNDPVAKKRFGQHFLRDTGVVGRIIRWIQPASCDLFLDLGAGDGALSVHLAPLVGRLIAIEMDQDRIPRLEAALAPFESATAVHADILQLDLIDLVHRYLEPGQRLRVAGNLPYNIGTAIIEKLLHTDLPFEKMFFMLQLEVAQRIMAQPGSKDYGFLSVYCQHRSDAQMGFKVSPACFVPRPRVWSAMVSINPKAYPQDSGLESDFESLLKAAFAYRRKTLENSLRRNPQLCGFLHDLLAQACIDGSRRAEAISVREYEYLAAILHEFKGNVRRLGGKPSDAYGSKD
jgi:16S rRNA (adenine1518-N6/adenine1519-N6)-dimethyltransferase